MTKVILVVLKTSVFGHKLSNGVCMGLFEYLENLYSEKGLELFESQEFKLIRGKLTGAGIANKELEYFQNYTSQFNNPKILIIGNAFGLSTFALSYIFKGSSVDVIDAESEGKDNQFGSEITRQIIEEKGLDIQLTIGYSPVDLDKAVRFDEYDIVFIDGLHTNEQVYLDFMGVEKYLNRNKFLCVFHDVGFCNLEQGVNKIFEKYDDSYEKVLHLPTEYSPSNMGILSKNVKIFK